MYRSTGLYWGTVLFTIAALFCRIASSYYIRPSYSTRWTSSDSSPLSSSSSSMGTYINTFMTGRRDVLLMAKIDPATNEMVNTAKEGELIMSLVNNAVDMIAKMTPKKKPKSTTTKSNNNNGNNPTVSLAEKEWKSVLISFSAARRQAIALPGLSAAHEYLSLPVEEYSVLDSSLVARVSGNETEDGADRFVLSLPLGDISSGAAALGGSAMRGGGGLTSSSNNNRNRVLLDATLRTEVIVRPDPEHGRVVMESGPIYFVPSVLKKSSTSKITLQSPTANSKTGDVVESPPVSSATSDEDVAAAGVAAAQADRGSDSETKTEVADSSTQEEFFESLPPWLVWNGVERQQQRGKGEVNPSPVDNDGSSSPSSSASSSASSPTDTATATAEGAKSSVQARFRIELKWNPPKFPASSSPSSSSSSSSATTVVGADGGKGIRRKRDFVKDLFSGQLSLFGGSNTGGTTTATDIAITGQQDSSRTTTTLASTSLSVAAAVAAEGEFGSGSGSAFAPVSSGEDDDGVLSASRSGVLDETAEWVPFEGDIADISAAVVSASSTSSTDKLVALTGGVNEEPSTVSTIDKNFSSSSSSDAITISGSYRASGKVKNHSDTDSSSSSTSSIGVKTTKGIEEEETMKLTAAVKVWVDMNLPVREDLHGALSFPPVNLLLSQAGALTTKLILSTVAPVMSTLLVEDFMKRRRRVEAAAGDLQLRLPIDKKTTPDGRSVRSEYYRKLFTEKDDDDHDDSDSSSSISDDIEMKKDGVASNDDDSDSGAVVSGEDAVAGDMTVENKASKWF